MLEDVSKFMNNKPIIVDVRGIFDGKKRMRKSFIVGCNVYYN